MSCGANEVCARFVERHRAALNFCALVLGYILYLLIGAGIFSAVELPYEKDLRQELRDARKDFLMSSPCVDERRLEELLRRVLEASNYGVTVHGTGTENGTDPGQGQDQNWDFVSSLFFTSTVLTTTGYGHTVPLSDEGKAFCIVYSLFGIPLTLLFLSAVVQRIMVLVTRRPISYFHRRWAVSRPVLSIVHALGLGLLMTLALLVVPSLIFVTTEKDWNFLESLYFCFISLTTIGLGDYVPGSTHSKDDRPHPHLYRLGITVYLLVGLICVLVMLETCCELPQMRRLRQRFYHEQVHELDPEAATIMDREQPPCYSAEPPPTIPSVSEQAESLRQGGGPSYTAANGVGGVNGKLR